LSAHHSRYWLIELLAWWEGRVQPSQLALYWQYSRQHASKILHEYISAYPHAFKYVAKDKNYQPLADFIPAHISQEADEYLNWLTGYSPGPQQQMAAWTLQLPPRNITPQLMRPIVQALREGRRVENATEALSKKLAGAQTPDYQAEFDPAEAERVGAFVGDALSEEDAAKSNTDPMDSEQPEFLDGEGPSAETHAFITRMNARDLYGMKDGETVPEAIARYVSKEG